MSDNELKNLLEKADLIIRPCAIVCSPKLANIIKENFEDKYEVFVSELVEPDKVYVMERKAIEPYIFNKEAENDRTT